MRGMLITLSVYTAILAAMLWAMQVGGILPEAKDMSGWQGQPHFCCCWPFLPSRRRAYCS